MRDFHEPSNRTVLDQADGLRRLFHGHRRRVLPLVANPHVAFSSVVLDRVAERLAARGHQVLVVDAGAGSPVPSELALVDLSACIERLSPRVTYIAARGLPMAHVDTRGCSGAFIDLLQQAAPQADVMLLHAEAGDLARLLMRREARPLLIAADHPESIKHAYAAVKVLAGRCGLMTFDLLLAAGAQSPRAQAIAKSLAQCADSFLGALLHDWALVDPVEDAPAGADDPLLRVLASQLALGAGAVPAVGSSHPAHARGRTDSLLNRIEIR